MLAFLKKVGSESDNLTFGKEGLPLSVEEEARFLSLRDESRFYRVSAFLQDGTVIGDIHLTRGSRRCAHTGEVGICVVQEYWGKGVASLLLEKMISWASRNGVTKINLVVRADNLRAKAFYAKHGFFKEGDNKRDVLIDGMYFDGEYWGLLL